MRTVSLIRLRDLTLAQSSSRNLPSHLSAASGLIKTPAGLFVVADDELHLGVFSPDGTEPGRLVRLFQGMLPGDKAPRKARKPDLETLLLLPPFQDAPHRLLVAMGSGSTPKRRRGVALHLDGAGALTGEPLAFDLEPLFSSLSRLFETPNIEGAVVRVDELWLFQRGNKNAPENVVVRLPLDGFRNLLSAGQAQIIEMHGTQRIDLGSVHGVPYSITDAAALPDGRTIVTAVAEDTADAYADGAFLGAMVGVLDRDLVLQASFALDPPAKVEGVHAELINDRIELLLVTDADNPAAPATLFKATLPPTSS